MAESGVFQKNIRGIFQSKSEFFWGIPQFFCNFGFPERLRNEGRWLVGKQAPFKTKNRWALSFKVACGRDGRRLVEWKKERRRRKGREWRCLVPICSRFLIKKRRDFWKRIAEFSVVLVQVDPNACGFPFPPPPRFSSLPAVSGGRCGGDCAVAA